MTEEQRAAYVISQSVCCMVEAMGMVSMNMQGSHRGEAIAYIDEHFTALIDKWGIHHNGVMGVFRP